MADRPPWYWVPPRGPAEQQRQAKAHYEDWFKEFIFNELTLRFGQFAARNAGQTGESLHGPPPADARQKSWHVRALDPVELAAQAVPMIRDIFEDYWAEGRENGRVYRGHNPTAEDMAAEFGGVTREKLDQRLKKAKHRRPVFK